MQGTNGQEAINVRPASLPVTHETAATSAAALAKSRTEARIMQALSRPRDLDDVRVKMLKECRRPGFAEAARYSVPRGGKKIEGPSIRFAEMALRCMGNLTVETPTTYEDPEKRIMRVEVTDLEANSSYSIDITVSKTVERKQLGRGQVALATRANSYGEQVYIVTATDDELAVKQAALVSKAVRTLVLRLVPGDLIDEGMWTVLETQRSADKADPDAARKKLADAFSQLGVSPSMLATHLGHELGASTPAELADLRAIYAALRDGEATWATVTAKGEAAEGDDAGTKARAAGGGRASAAAAAVKAKAEAAKKPIEATDAPAWDPSTGEVT